MTYLAHDTETNRIKRRAWTDNEPAWFSDPPEGCNVAHEPGFSQSSLQAMMKEANSIHESGEDYDPETETSVGYLCYDSDTGEIYPDAEIKEIEERE